MSGGGGGGDQTVSNEPPSWAVPHLQYGGSEARNIYQNNPQGYYPGQTWLPFNEFQQSGINAQLGNITDLYGLGAGSQYGYGNLLAAGDPNSAMNQEWSDVLGRRIGEQFSQNIMPAISDQAIAAGQTGSSRQGIAEGLAAQGAQREMADALTQFHLGQYGQGLDATKSALLAGPQVAAMTQMPYQSMYQVGDMIRNQEMLPLQESIDRYYYNQQSPWDALQNYSSIINGMPFGSTQTTSMPSNTIGNMLGGGMAGYSAFGPLSTSLLAAGPPTAGTAALLGLGPIGFGLAGAALGGLS